ncbi:uncharacterized protein LOC118195667 [Stegodyphus dumicola]|uniref:uncharacterized protein LOC118195667 n=1 Tax=Stegodyphus dumicola TaxID=202533 RepID=UPI0015ABDA56|nr:uncharacterized protein LOC118195667 [Stegodyphus dumicola]
MPIALRAISLETIIILYPPGEWLHIYTDSSLLDFTQGAGAGVFCDLTSFYLHVGSHTTHFDGEVEAIHLALQQLFSHLSPLDKAVSLSDSSSALQALESNLGKHSACVHSFRELLSRIQTKIAFQWVPSHCGPWGNKMVDLLVKKDTDILQRSSTELFTQLNLKLIGFIKNPFVMLLLVILKINHGGCY